MATTFEQVTMPNPDWMTIHVRRPNGDVTIYVNDQHVSAAMCDALTTQANFMVEREVWSLRRAS